jgi:hypothetical protein
MRKPLFFGVLLLGLATAVPAQQHAVAPVAAPVVVARPVPVGAVAHPAAAPAHPAAAHPMRVAGTNVKPTVAHKRTPATLPSRPVPPPPLGGFVNSVTGATSACNRRGSTALTGLNACAPNTGVVLPFFAGGIYIPVPYYVDASAAPEQPADQQEEAANQPPDSNSREEEEGAAPVAPSRSYTSSNTINESLAQFVFVQRDGTKFYAVAYSFLNDKLHYVTKDGARRSVALDSLDFDATQKLNENLGNTINLPSLPASGVASNVEPGLATSR